MAVSRRNLLKMGAALAAAPLVGDLPVGTAGERLFSTGSPDLDRSLGGGLRMGSVLVVVGPRGSGKSGFVRGVARANGISDSYLINKGPCDMLSIVEREDGKFVGSVMLNAAEPATDLERAAMERDAAARSAFLTRWFARTRDVVHESGGLFAICVCGSVESAGETAWLDIPDYVITLHQSKPGVFKIRDRGGNGANA